MHEGLQRHHLAGHDHALRLAWAPVLHRQSAWDRDARRDRWILLRAGMLNEVLAEVGSLLHRLHQLLLLVEQLVSRVGIAVLGRSQVGVASWP